MEQNVSAIDRSKKVPVLNVPNALTVLRIVLVPIFIALLFQKTLTAQWWAVAVFVVASLSDHLDGEIARRNGWITDFGRIADPIADKALTLGAFLALSWMGDLPWYFTILVAIRELGITWWRSVLLRQGIVVAANMGGKLKTVLQLLLIFLMILPWASMLDVESVGMAIASYSVLITMWAALIVTVWSGIDYILDGRRMGKELKKEGV
ncbi:CDP-diacylglycerol--glycerol-3-phosphate 3-phosphatidyltransferase [Schaalia sp. Marseille-Q2122]|uniref:CDP-diacylglycerol--glycerol-3-phosphate 3-phosphatidyltransferase n=1 Tax=Schaalia sp. Marseille-Q2122 TaxID=2736604 RepID=UPI00158DB30C|nr:CDP-diacylglycerol--glycerol-3-phosphate 3-phosphatidyltransferase [Schaalia sp. Marseille-Q2122]